MTDEALLSQPMTADEVRAMLRRRIIKEYGSQSRYAEANALEEKVMGR